MNEQEPDSQSFIIKVWIEEKASASSQDVWRGHIVAVSNGEKRYLQDLDEIAGFITPYLREMGVRLGVSWRIRRWLRHMMG